jgi:hypothetical protein
MKKNALVLFILILLLITAVVFAYNSGGHAGGKNNISVIPAVKEKACTMEAKLCPDGTYVGRSGPRCEFSPCPATGPKPVGSGGIKGKITLSPICPVERMPPDPSCAPKPYETSISIKKSGGSSLVKTIQSKSDGTFSTDLPPGSYVLDINSGKAYPQCPETKVEILSGKFAAVDISCDTGIR